MSVTPPKHYVAAGLGSTNRFTVEIDESLDETSELQMSISTRSWTFRFALSAREDAGRILSFLHEHTGHLKFSEIVVGSFQDMPVRLIKDDEFADGFWFRAYGGGLMVEFVLVADDLATFFDAVARAIQD